MPILARTMRQSGTLISSKDSHQLVSGCVTLAPGAEVGEHRTGSGEELIVLLNGTVEVSVGEHARTVRSPGVILVPAHAPHNVNSGGSDPARYVYVYVTALNRS